jgi:deoxyribodipyrimidine photo-lyase
MKKHLCWIRRDLRLHDHHALSKALTAPCEMVFCFDPLILDKLTDKRDRRLTFIIDSLKEMERKIQETGSSLHILYGDPVVEIPKLAQKLQVTAVFTNRDYEPYAKKRDESVGLALQGLEISFHTFKDSVFYEQKEVLNGSGQIYKVFTPYKNKWLETLSAQENIVSDFKVNLKSLVPWKNPKNILDTDWHRELGFIKTSSLVAAGSKAALKRLKDFDKKMKDYGEARDIPSLEGTSNLSPSIRHGCLSVRDMVRAGLANTTEGGGKWLSEVIWRDFYHMLLDAFPHVEKK